MRDTIPAWVKQNDPLFHTPTGNLRWTPARKVNTARTAVIGVCRKGHAIYLVTGVCVDGTAIDRVIEARNQDDALDYVCADINWRKVEAQPYH